DSRRASSDSRGWGWSSVPRSVSSLDSVMDADVPACTKEETRTTTMPSPPSWALEVTRQSVPLRLSLSPVLGSNRRVKSYSKSPFGKRMTKARAGIGGTSTFVYLERALLFTIENPELDEPVEQRKRERVAGGRSSPRSVRKRQKRPEHGRTRSLF